MTARPTIAYQPALDGVRALAVAAVLLFHAEVPGFGGGYLGVSVFFTLSGFLITSLLLHEHRNAGSIDLGVFYARRVRRLLPASALCLAGIVVIAVASDVFAGVTDLRREIAGSILQVANWVFLTGAGSYQQIFQDTGGARSPVEHFWSLAIEEQFYWVWPPTMLLVLSRARSHRGRVRTIGALTVVFIAAAPVIAIVWGADAAYWATPARIAEILLGALLAVALAGRPAPDRVARLAPIALAVLAACVALFPPSSGPAYAGWLPAVGVVSAALVLGLQAPGPLRTALSAAPLVWLGRISYGVYLYHWPVYVLMDEQRTGLDRPLLVPLQMATTLVLAQVSSMLVEQPIRGAKRLPNPVTFATAGLATAAVAVLAVTIVPRGLGEYWLGDDATVAEAAIDVGEGRPSPLALAPTTTATRDTVALETIAHDVPVRTEVSPTAPPTTAAPSTTTAPPPAPPLTSESPLPPLTRPVRIVVAGDSTALATGTGLLYWAAANPELAQVELFGAPGCGFLVGGERREGGFKPAPEACTTWMEHDLPARVAELQPDVVMLMVTSWDLVDHRWEGVEMTPLDDPFQQRLIVDYQAFTEKMLALGAGSVAWIKAPIPNVHWLDTGIGQEEPARHEVARQVMDEIAAAKPADVGVIDLATWMDEVQLTDDHDVRPDGVHFEPTAAVDIATRFLGERLVRIAVRA